MSTLPKKRSSRRLFCGAALIFASALAVLLARGTRKPQIPDCPEYRQWGAPDAKVVIVEYSDFQCPACAVATLSVKRLMALYGPRLRILFKHRPWAKSHSWAKSAALAAECAGRQGKFWEFHDLLYLHQDEWAQNPKANDVLTHYAESLNLDPEAYAKCVEEPKTMAVIDADMKEADDRWINSTPTFFINGERVVGNRQLREDGVRKIERILGI